MANSGVVVTRFSHNAPVPHERDEEVQEDDGVEDDAGDEDQGGQHAEAGGVEGVVVQVGVEGCEEHEEGVEERAVAASDWVGCESRSGVCVSVKKERKGGIIPPQRRPSSVVVPLFPHTHLLRMGDSVPAASSRSMSSWKMSQRQLPKPMTLMASTF